LKYITGVHFSVKRIYFFHLPLQFFQSCFSKYRQLVIRMCPMVLQ
jgi:hypothetical protein